MSYCRFSSDDFKSDVYCYESFDGIHVHVAASRYVIDRTELEKIPKTIPGLIERRILLTKLIDNAEQEKIGLSCDGKSFILGEYTQVLEFLMALRDEGYYVPESAITEIHDDIKDQLH